MERKSSLIRSPPDSSLIETQELPATEKMCTQDLDDTQLIEATQDLPTDDGVPPTAGEAIAELSCDEASNNLQLSDLDTNRDSGNPLKDVSNIPLNASMSNIKIKSNTESTRNSTHHGLERMEELCNSEAILPSQGSVLSSDENDLTPEIPDTTAPNHRGAGSKEKLERVPVPLSQSSGSSENPESTASGSQPSSSQLSSSDHGSGGDCSQRTKPKTLSDSSLNFDVTQDLFLSEEAILGESSLSPYRTAKFKENVINNEPAMLIKSSIPATRHSDENGTKGRQFRVPEQTSKGDTVESVKPRQRRGSGGNVLKLSILKEMAKGSPPLDSQAVSLRVSGSSSENAVPDEDNDVFVARDSPNTPGKQQAYGLTPDRDGVSKKMESTDTGRVVMVKKLFVFSENLVDCKIEADRVSGEVISLQIGRIKNYSTEAKQLVEPDMPTVGTITPNTEVTLPSGVFGGHFSEESWEAAMTSSFQEGLKRSLTVSFQKVISANKKEESCERRGSRFTPVTPKKPVTPVTPVTPGTPVPAGRYTARKRKLSSSSPSTGGVAVDSSISEPATSPSPFKRPKVEHLSARRDAIRTPKQKLSSPLRVSPSLLEFNSSNALPEGAKVFATWSDKRYYAATVLRQSGLDHYIVKYHDGKEKDLPINKICVINTFEINDPVLAKASPKGYYKMGVVVDVKTFDLTEDKYVIKFNSDGNLVELSRDDLSLSEQMIQNHRLKNSNAEVSRKKLVTIDLGNVLHGKRTRSVVSPSPVPGPSGFKSKLSASESSSYDEIEKTDTFLKITGIEVEENNVDPLAGKGSRKTKARRKTVIPDEEQLLNEYGPIPEEGCKLFFGLSFVLTCAVRHDHMPKERRRMACPTTDHSDVDSLSDSDCFCGPFNKIKNTMSKSRLTEQLVAGGGRILTNLDDLDSKTDLDDVYVIANRPCLTAVFVHSLALGIKGVLFDTVIHCCKKGIIFKEYIEKYKIFLDAGYSIKERRLVPWNELKNKASKPLGNYTIHVYSRDRSFTKYWEKILTCAGATLVKFQTMDDVQLCTAIVAEPPVPGLLRSSAREMVTPIVSTDWIVQSLIHKEALPFDWHSDFRVHCDDSD